MKIIVKELKAGFLLISLVVVSAGSLLNGVTTEQELTKKKQELSKVDAEIASMKKKGAPITPVRRAAHIQRLRLLQTKHYILQGDIAKLEVGSLTPAEAEKRAAELMKKIEAVDKKINEMLKKRVGPLQQPAHRRAIRDLQEQRKFLTKEWETVQSVSFKRFD